MPYLIGVSGGRDSVALLHWLINLGYRKLIVCHLNHQLRRRSSDDDARFVKNLAAKYELDFEVGAANVRAFAKKKKTSVETTARNARYSFFAKNAKRHGCHTIFIAHHADDLVETFVKLDPGRRSHWPGSDARCFYSTHWWRRLEDRAPVAPSLAQ